MTPEGISGAGTREDAGKADLAFDAFISYSHAADDLLAPRLQVGLQRFAKPWWKRRAMRVFRDESSLSASPHLWGSITEALDDSSWFVLLLSPDAAGSHWVGEEIEYWISDDSRVGRVLPVVTDGEFSWVEGDVTGSAVPPSLKGVFSSEPRWVDLRFAKGETQLDLKSPDFAAAVADIASAVRGIPKDELESEEVRQHRRTIRTAWAGALLVLLLGVAASIAAVFAFNEQARANQEAVRANENAAEADSQRAEAESQREQAEQLAKAEAAARDDADREAAIARAQSLVLEAEKAVESDPELAVHLALAAIDGFRVAGEDTVQAVSALRTAVAADRVVSRLSGGAVGADSTGRFVAISSPEGVRVVDLETGRTVDRCGSGRSFPPAFSPDGSLLAFSPGTGRTGLAICNRSTAEFVELNFWVDRVAVFGPNGHYLAVASDTGGISVWSLTDGRFVYETNLGSGPDFSNSGLLSYAAGDQVRIVDPRDGSLVRSFDLPGARIWHTAWSSDDADIAVSTDSEVVILDAQTGVEISRSQEADAAHVVPLLDGRGLFTLASPSPPVWLEDRHVFAMSGPSGLKLVSADSGRPILELHGLGQRASSYADLPGKSLLVAEGGGDVVIFDTSRLGGFEVGGWVSRFSGSQQARFMDDGAVVVAAGKSFYVLDDPVLSGVAEASSKEPAWVADGDSPIVPVGGEYVAHVDAQGQWSITESETGEVRYRTTGPWVVQGVSEDGKRAAIYNPSSPCDGTFVVDTSDGSVVSTLFFECDLGFAVRDRRFVFSPSGDLVLGTASGQVAVEDPARFANILPMGLFDVQSGAFIAGFGERGGPVGGFSRDESELAVLGYDGALVVFDLKRLVAGADWTAATKIVIEAHDTDPVSLSLSPDGSMAVTSSTGEPLRLWDLNTGRLLGEFGADLEGSDHFADFHPTEPWLLVTSSPDIVRIFTLDIDELIGIAESRLTRELTAAECEQYPGACASE